MIYLFDGPESGNIKLIFNNRTIVCLDMFWCLQFHKTLKTLKKQTVFTPGPAHSSRKWTQAGFGRAEGSIFLAPYHVL